MLAFGIALGVGVLIAGWTWRARLDEVPGRFAAIARAIGVTALVLLLLDPGIVAAFTRRRPLVLLDHSISMHAATGRFAEARDSALAAGDTAAFGEIAPGLPADRTMLGDALAGATATGRPVVVVTDGEIADAAAISGDLLAGATIRNFPRRAAADIAVVSVAGPTRLTSGDTLTLDVELRRIGAAPDSATIALREGAATLAQGVARFAQGRQDRVTLRLPLPSGRSGARWFDVVRVGPPDGEPGDDVRWWHLEVSGTPGIVVLADAPDWDGRELFRAVRDVVGVPVRGYVQLMPGAWRRTDDLSPVPPSEVQRAAREAAVLVVHGDPAPWLRSGKARLLWPAIGARGDWYLEGTPASPLAGAFSIVADDSLPPATAAAPVRVGGATGWVGATARLARRGPAVPVIGGEAGPAGRSITLGVTGLYRWGFRGGSSAQAWRTLISEAMAWLLAAPSATGAVARPLEAVTMQGHPVRFRWVGATAPMPVPVTLSDSVREWEDTLRFDGAGEASLALPVGRYRYRLAGGGEGSIGVEPFAEELLPGPVTLAARSATLPGSPPRHSMRDQLWLFGLTLLAFGVEWLLRRRMGLR